MFMTNDFSHDFQYNSCVARGICSINPRTYSLQAVLIKYLKFVAKYASALYKNGTDILNVKALILNTIANSVSNPEFTENTYSSIVLKFKEELPKILEEYKICFSDNVEMNLNLNNMEFINQTDNIISSIKYGESILHKARENTSDTTRDLYGILFVIAKSISINLLDLESYGQAFDKAFLTLLEIFSCLDNWEQDVEILKELIISAVNVDDILMKSLRKVQEERYGQQEIVDVSYTTTPAKAVLVVGSNIRELETILDKLKNYDIDIYTHDDMMLAHTFPFFQKYEKLKGQYGQGTENCLIDFATFPGPIILTKHSLHNIENLYRGRLFTTDFTNPKGVISIINNDFSDVIKTAELSKGFKTGKQCESVTIGYNFRILCQEIEEKLESGNYKKVVLIGLDQYSPEQSTYFDKLVKLLPENVLIISFSYKFEKTNVINVNTCFDSYAMIRVFDFIRLLDIPVATFFPKCDRNTISQIIYVSNNKKTKVFVGNCTPILLNPSLMNTLFEHFRLNNLSTAKEDIEIINAIN